MPYRNGPIVAGQYYHVFNRTVESRLLFRSDANYRYFLRRISKILPLHPLKIICYCLMPNHFHFLLKTLKDDTVSGFISLLLNGYVKALNIQSGIKGPLFPSRFKHVLIESDAQLIHLMRYIHLNPVKASLVRDPADWPYSNYLEFIKPRDEKPRGLGKGHSRVHETAGDPGVFSASLETRDLYFQSPEEYAAFVKDMTVENPKAFEKYCLE
jgi:REP element-mobilizing transposase RayT